MVTYGPASTGLYAAISGLVLVTHVLVLGKTNLSPWTPEKIAILAVVALFGLTWKAIMIVLVVVSVTTYCIFKDMFERDDISETFNVATGLMMSFIFFSEGQQLEFVIFIVVFCVAGYDKFIIAAMFAVMFPLMHYQSNVLLAISMMNYVVLYLSIRARVANIVHYACVCVCNIAACQYAIMYAQSDIIFSVVNMFSTIMCFVVYYYALENGAFFWPDWCDKMKLDWYVNIRDGRKRQDIKMDRLRQIFFPPVDKYAILRNPVLDFEHAFVAEFSGSKIKIHDNDTSTRDLFFITLLLNNIDATRLLDGIAIPKNSVATRDIYYLLVKTLHKFIGSSDIAPQILNMIMEKNYRHAIEINNQ